MGNHLQLLLNHLTNLSLRRTACFTLAALVSLTGSACAIPLFSGISDLQLLPATGNKLNLQFQSDLPFQCSVKTIDVDHVVIRLINARLSDRMKGPQLDSNHQLLNLAPNALIRQGTLLLTPEASSTSDEIVEEIQLEGPGIGHKQISVQGATPSALPDTRIATTPDTSVLKLKQPPENVAATATSFEPPEPAPQKREAKRFTQPAQPNRPTSPAPSPDVSPDISREQTLALLPNNSPPASPSAVKDAPPSPSESRTIPTKTTTGSETVVMMPPFAKGTHPAKKHYTPVKPQPAQPEYTPGYTSDYSSDYSGPQITAVIDPDHPYAPQTANAAPRIISIPAPVPEPAFRPSSRLTLNSAPPFYQKYALSPDTVESYPTGDHSRTIAAGPTIQKPLPRYRGGAPPISFTVSSTGESYTLPNPAAPGRKTTAQNVVGQNTVGQSVVDGGYNTLSYSEPARATRYESSQSANTLLKEALAQYRENNLDAALDTVERALALDSSNPALHAAQGEIFIKQKNYIGAVSTYDRASRYAPPGTYDDRLVIALYRSGNKERTLQTLKNMLQRNPEQPAFQYMLGTLYQELGQTALAIPHLKAAARLNPVSSEVFYNLGLAYELEGNKDLARIQYSRAAQINPSDTEIVQALNRVKS